MLARTLHRMTRCFDIAARMCNAIGLPPRAGTSLRFTGAGELPSAFAVTDFAAAAIATPLLFI